MNFFKLVLFIHCLAFSQTNSSFENYNKRLEKSIDHKEDTHKVYFQGGETDKNRITNNEYAINFLKKELSILKKKIEVLEKALKEEKKKNEKTKI